MMKITTSSDDEMDRIEQELTVQSKKQLYLAMNKMMNLAVNYAPVDTGILKNSIKLRPEEPGSDTYDLTDGVEYGVYMEFGTGPHVPPVEPLKAWAKRHFGDEKIGWAIRAKIAKVGVKEHPFFRPALHEVQTIWLPEYLKSER